MPKVDLNFPIFTYKFYLISMKRADLQFDTRHFEKKRKAGVKQSTEDTFREIYDSNHWDGPSSVSGVGSGEGQTKEISIQIPRLVKALKVNRLLDVPCGDFNWFSKMPLDLDEYVGGDILPEIIESNKKRFNAPGRQFLKINLIEDPLPEADLLLCRDCLVHLSNEAILKAIQNIRRSSISYLLTTTFPNCTENEDIVTGDWRIINLEKKPFSLSPPLQLINEGCTEGKGTYSDKSLGLWKVSDL